jgi:hypothetical protein
VVECRPPRAGGQHQDVHSYAAVVRCDAERTGVRSSLPYSDPDDHLAVSARRPQRYCRAPDSAPEQLLVFGRQPINARGKNGLHGAWDLNASLHLGRGCLHCWAMPTPARGESTRRCLAGSARWTSLANSDSGGRSSDPLSAWQHPWLRRVCERQPGSRSLLRSSGPRARAWDAAVGSAVPSRSRKAGRHDGQQAAGARPAHSRLNDVSRNGHADLARGGGIRAQGALNIQCPVRPCDKVHWLCAPKLRCASDR